MAKVLTQTSEIQAFLDEMMAKEDAKNALLKRQIEELTQLINLNGSNTTITPTQIKFRENVILHIGNSKFDKVIKSTATIDDLFGITNAMLGTDKVGYKDRDDQGGVVWIRTTQDLHFMFLRYFAQELSFVQIIPIPMSDIAVFSKFNLRKEHQSKEDCAVFRCESAGPDHPWIFLAINSNLMLEDGLNYLQTIFGNISTIMFVDDTEDMIAVDSNESWEYCIDIGSSMAKTGLYPRLLIQLHI